MQFWWYRKYASQQLGWLVYHRIAYKCKCGKIIHRWNSGLASCGKKADVNLRVTTAARCSKVSTTRLREFELLSGMVNAMDTDYIATYFDRVHSVAQPRLQKLLIENRKTAGDDARKPLIMKATHQSPLIMVKRSVCLPSITMICDGAFTVWSLGKMNYCRAWVAYFCVYSETGLPLFFFYKCKTYCGQCARALAKTGSCKHEGTCMRTKGATNVLMTESLGARELGLQIKAGNILVFPHTMIK